MQGESVVLSGKGTVRRKISFLKNKLFKTMRVHLCRECAGTHRSQKRAPNFPKQELELEVIVT